MRKKKRRVCKDTAASGSTGLSPVRESLPTISAFSGMRHYFFLPALIAAWAAARRAIGTRKGEQLT